MSSSEDEDDKFLYGSDNEEPKNEKKRPREAAEDDNEGPTSDKVVGQHNNDLKRPKLAKDSLANASSDEEESGSESDSDIEFIISTGPDPHRLDSSTVPGSNNAIVTVSEGANVGGETMSKSTATATTAEISTLNALGDTEVAGTSELDNETLGPETTTKSGTSAEGIDLDKEGLYNDEPVSTIDPEVLKEKPWRQPGANISDYFNYGFNEYTWMEYLHRQEKLRQEYNPRRILMGLMTLQQQGRLDQPQGGHQSMPDNMAINNSQPTNNDNMMHKPTPPLPNFPMPPMFGGFSPFMPPGMMAPMNRMPNQNQNQGQNQNQNPNQLSK